MYNIEREMEEPIPCLVRSLSQPSDSFAELIETDPLRALRSSVSFGRYVSDSSSWEKWSCFSNNNRYLEEAEKISKPGSVAEKKALLEAHFKKISAKKAIIGTHNLEPSMENNFSTNSFISDEIQEKRGPNGLDHEAERKDLDMNRIEGMELETKTIDTVARVVECKVPKLPEKESEHSKNSSSKQDKMSIVDNANQRNLVSTSKKKQSPSPSKFFTDLLTSKFRSSIKLSPSSKDDNTSQTSQKTEKGSLEKKLSTLKSLHMSVDHSSGFDESSKKSTAMVEKTGDQKGVRTLSKIPRNTSTPHQNPIRASVAGTLTQHSATIQIKKSIETLDRPAVPRNTAEPHSPPIDSKPREHNTQSPSVASSPFSLRCEGRVAKRKEFFQKLEEKQKAKEAIKVHQAKSKVPLTRPHTPRDGKQLISSMVLDMGSRPLWRPDKIHDATKNKETSTRTPIRASCTMLKKNKIENASPNIQRWL